MSRLLAKRIHRRGWIDNEIPADPSRRWQDRINFFWSEIYERMGRERLVFLSTPTSTEPIWIRPAPLFSPFGFTDDIAPWVQQFHRNAKWLAEMHGSIEDAAVADALDCDWPELDDE